MDTTIFKKLGLGDKEMAVYLALLENGASSVRNLAVLADLNRGTAYDILKKLQELGLVSFFHKNTKQNFVAEDPERILKLLADREQDLKKSEEKIKELIPELKSLQEKGGGKPTTKFYEGRSGVKFILDDVLLAIKNQTDKNYYVYSAAGVREDVYTAYPDFNKKRIKNNIKANTISLSEGGGTYGVDERKWLKTEKDGKGNMTYILIYADKCAFISRDSHNNPVGVIIENKMIYETQRALFLQMWKLI
ncbi:MAG: helix-turn-helix domain-containing protein [Patescibacteria group bacterium]|nr:helix-turn-helix domain-containing protein [Patescibacteria group bacterium]